MKILILTLLLFSVVNNLFAQSLRIEPNCDYKLIYFEDQGMNTDTTYEVFLKNYIDRFYCNERIYVSPNKSDLEEFSTQIRNNIAYQGIYKNGNINISTFITLRSLEAKEEAYLADLLYYLDEMGLLRPNRYYRGIIKRDSNTLISKISININGKELLVPDSIFNYLYNPSICEKYYSINPAKVFYSKKDHNVYIYLYGSILYESLLGYGGDPLNPSVDSYVAKIIVDVEKERCSQISISGWSLNKYGWIECENFWVF